MFAQGRFQQILAIRLVTYNRLIKLVARNSARAAFAADIPPALLADKLGLSISTAVAWSKVVGAAHVLRGAEERACSPEQLSDLRSGEEAQVCPGTRRLAIHQSGSSAVSQHPLGPHDRADGAGGRLFRSGWSYRRWRWPAMRRPAQSPPRSHSRRGQCGQRAPGRWSRPRYAPSGHHLHWPVICHRHRRHLLIPYAVVTRL